MVKKEKEVEREREWWAGGRNEKKKRHSPKTPPPLHPQPPSSQSNIPRERFSHPNVCRKRSLAGSFCVPIAFAGNLVTLMNSKSISMVRRRQTRLWVVTAILLGKYPGSAIPQKRRYYMFSCCLCGAEPAWHSMSAFVHFWRFKLKTSSSSSFPFFSFLRKGVAMRELDGPW
ncbi:hypothetical protein CEXT_744041 [Caerostris extrusa]|uniref:Uncharacterized protein n=1 Tax=Caerostris extrusa TaxID=172846 RepID=A0AAV4Q604_CAEEX|nr:hypothetical protein CEXT_744041 [Caerostris extrusa]